MKEALRPYLPESALEPCLALIKRYKIHLRIVNMRVTRHGDYRRLPNGQQMITVNGMKNPYRFLLTFVHEVAHLIAYKRYGARIKPHGTEWKRTFTESMLPFLDPNIFPNELLPVLAAHMKNPRASSDTDQRLAIALKAHDPPNGKTLIFELPKGSQFRLYNGRIFQLGDRIRKRYECVELSSGKRYLFSPQAEVEPLDLKS